MARSLMSRRLEGADGIHSDVVCPPAGVIAFPVVPLLTFVPHSASIFLRCRGAFFAGPGPAVCRCVVAVLLEAKFESETESETEEGVPCGTYKN